MRVLEPKSGRVLDIATTEPGVQFYTGNFLDGTIKGKAGRVVRAAYGLLPGDAAFPGLAESSEFPDDDPSAGPDLLIEDGVYVPCAQVVDVPSSRRH